MRRKIEQNSSRLNKTIIIESKGIDKEIFKALDGLKIKRVKVNIKVEEIIKKRFIFLKEKSNRIIISVKSDKEYLIENLERFLKALDIEYNNIDYSIKNNSIVLTIVEPKTREKLIGKHGKTIQSLEYLVNKIAQSNNIKHNIIITNECRKSVLASKY
jgi:predicted RNA-binding protein Jag